MAGYEKFWDIISVEKTLYNSAERRGMAIGMEKGIEKGIEKGQYIIAGNLKRQGVSVDIIAQCTGLSLEIIATL